MSHTCPAPLAPGRLQPFILQPTDWALVLRLPLSHISGCRVARTAAACHLPAGQLCFLMTLQICDQQPGWVSTVQMSRTLILWGKLSCDCLAWHTAL